MSDIGRSDAGFYEFGDFRIDRANFGLYKGDAQRSLPPRAFDLLVYLIENRDRVVEKQELFEQVWQESFVTDNALTRAIKEIRHELDDDARSPRFIQTVHKRGYRFVGEVTDRLPQTLQGQPGIPEVVEEPAEYVPTDDNAAHQYQKVKWAVGLVVLVLLVSTAVLFYFRSEKQARSLVVLPLENSSGDASAEYMSDGITESLINSLSRLPQLKVIPRTTAFRYKRKEVDAQQIGRELGVDVVVTGRVTQQGDSFIVQTELTDTEDGSQFWGDRFSRKLSDIFLLQEEIAKVISQKLQIRLSGEEERRLTKRYTENAKAYELYLRGRYSLAKLTPPEVQASILYFQQAIDADPTYALAYVGLADAYSALALSVDMPATEFYPKAKTAAQKALGIDEELAEAHTALGFAMQFYDWDFKAAENQHKRALELNPNSADAHFAHASLFALIGRLDDALAEVGRARELDPLSLRINALEGRFLVLAGRPDEGLARLQATIELEPNYFLAHLFASNAYLEKGMYGEAVAEATKARDLSGGNAEAIAWMGYSLAASGRRDEAKAVLDELRKRSTERYVPPYNFAILHFGLGEREETLRWLEQGIAERDPKMLFLKTGTQWKDLRDDPRFIALLARINIRDQ
ncbi:MAG TPA: winged helix-turn-helix domain-containing protein [Pyrinomonadaceae bacterium]|nr:winged helix-turn-helix domain-containing protein [Pyrinomonadaceae bacterium]